MSYSVNQNVIYTSLTGKEEDAIILLRKIDFPEGYINSDHARAGFDYQISVIRNGETKHIFCNEGELK